MRAFVVGLTFVVLTGYVCHCLTYTPSARIKIVEVESLSPTGKPVRRSLGYFIVTAYCPCEKCCGDYADGVTASGHVIQRGDRFCAADRIIPFYKHLIIEDYDKVPVLDRGKAIKGNRIDVYFDTHEEALQWGRREIEIFCWVKGE